MDSYRSLSFGVLALILFLASFGVSEAAVLSLSPTSGAFSVGSTFDVSVFLNTDNQSVNAVEMSLGFPPDKLQLVSPATSKSVISVWTSQPRFNNAAGRIDLQGGIPGGINVSNGLITTLTFRVKSVGQAFIKFLDNSKVLLNDGLGTDTLKQTQNGVYQLVLPPPEGPIVASKTHPEESRWYSNPNVILDWVSQFADVEGYSYMLSDDPTDVPDNISEGVQKRVVYKNVADGTHYFHIKSLRAGIWGGVTHFAVNIDATPPAEFKIDIAPSARTVRREPIISFFTTDALSGLDHYELKLVSLTPNAGASTESGSQEFFIEAESPYIPAPLEIGDYDVIVRAYDKAGNFREAVQRLQIRQAIFEIFGDEGIMVRSRVVVSWGWFFVIMAALLGALVWGGVRIKRWHYAHHLRLANKELPLPLRSQLEELKRFRKKYGKALMILLLIIPIGLIGLISPISPIRSAFAQTAELAPPFVSTVSRNISNNEIFYIGGKTDTGGASVVIYLQNLQTGETQSQVVTSEKNGDWFYRHPTFLSTGNYLLWAQTKIGDLMSPPSPQIQMQVRPTAIQFGASRISFETLYFIIALILFLAVLGLVAYILIHAYHGRRKHKHFWKEVKEAEESIKRGFAVLRRDIQAELAVVKNAKLNKALKEEEMKREAELLKDLEYVERFVGKEVWDIEKTEHSD